MHSDFSNVLKALELYIIFLDEDIMEKRPSDKRNSVDLSSLFTTKQIERANSQQFIKFIEAIEKAEVTSVMMPYSEVTLLIYEQMDVRRELLDQIGSIILTDFEIYNETNQVEEETKKIFFKLREHINLSIVQRNHISTSLSDRVGTVDKKLEDAEKTIYSLSKEISKIEKSAQEKVDKLVMQFIAILGIFAAIMMGAFGSFQGFTSIFSNADNIPIGKILLISAAGASGVSLILFLLLHSISKLTSFNLSNCDCKKRRKRGIGLIRESLQNAFSGGDTEPKCTCSVFNKYPTIFILNYLFYYIAVTGFIFMYFNFYNYFDMKFWIHLIVIITYFIVATVVLIFVHRYLINKNANEKILFKFISDIKITPSYFKKAFRQ